MARRLMREEGLMCGGSSGSAMWAAIKYIKENKIGKGKRVVVLLPDNIRNYMTKHLNDDWMYERNYITEAECAAAQKSDFIPNTDWGQDMTVADLPLPDAVFMDATTTIGDAVKSFYSSGFAQYPVREASGKITGVLTKTEVMKQLVKKRVTEADPVSKLVQRELRHVSNGTTLDELARVLARNRFALVEKTKFVTTSDIMKKISPPTAQPADAKTASVAEGGCCKVKLAAAAVVGVGIAALGTFLVMKNKN